MVLDIVEGQRRGEGPKYGQNSLWGKNIEKTREPKIQYGVKPDIFKYAPNAYEFVKLILRP